MFECVCVHVCEGVYKRDRGTEISKPLSANYSKKAVLSTPYVVRNISFLIYIVFYIQHKKLCGIHILKIICSQIFT